MARYLFDIETDGLLEDLTKVHCIVLCDLDTGERGSYPPDAITEALYHLERATELWGHAIQSFDIPAIKKVYPVWTTDAVVYDTLVLSHLLWPDTFDEDIALINSGKMPRKNSKGESLIKRHSLEAWGYRLGELKGDFKSTTDWKEFSQEMLDYCIQDTAVNLALYRRIQAAQPSPTAVRLEHEFSACLDQMMACGVAFNVEAARRISEELMVERVTIDQDIRRQFPGWTEEYETPKKKQKKTRFIEFNPGSRQRVARMLQETCGWKPKEYTETGLVELSEDILGELSYPIAKSLARRFMLEKRLSALAEGDGSYLDLQKASRIHGYIGHNGTVTGRCTHSKPNLGNIVAVDKPYGKEIRGLFGPSEGMVQVGCDLSGLELRMLAHYLAWYDGGAYAQTILKGDIHTANQKAAGLATRNQAKTFIYAFLYGAGPEKLGSVAGGGRVRGLSLRKSFLAKTPGLSRLLRAVVDHVGGEHVTRQDGRVVRVRPDDPLKPLRAIDGRYIHIRSEHSALNALLQSAGAIVTKKATCLAVEAAKGLGANLILHVHDEFQFECPPENAEALGKACVQAIKDAGQFFNLRIPLDGEYKIGKNWAETH